MFTGIVDHCGIIVDIKRLSDSYQMWIDSHFSELMLGESIAVDGICLTVTEIIKNRFRCDLSPETLNVTTARNFKLSTVVNLERALQLSSRLGGHFVTGHIDQVAKVKSIRTINEFTEMEFCLQSTDDMRFIIKKGSIAINGTSLTINEVYANSFNVMLIPHTLENTNLSHLQEDNKVNIEFDMMAKLIVKQYQNYASITG